MKKWLLSLCMILALTACDNKKETAQANAKPVIKIGVSLPLTGDSQESGNIAKKTIEMFENDLAKQALKNTYQFIVDDNGYDNKRIVSINNKFIYMDKVDAVVSYWNIGGIITADKLKDTSILHINFGSDRKAIQSNHDFLFYSSPTEQAKLLLSEAKKRGITKVAILGCNNDWSYIMQKAVENEKEAYGINIVNTQFVNIGERNFNITLEKMRKTEPELYILFLETPEFEIARRKMLEIGIKEPVTSSEVPDYTAEKELFEGMWYVTLPEGDKDFNEKFKTYSKMDNTYGASYIYDIMSLLVKSYEKAQTKNDAAEAILNIKSFNGKTGAAVLTNQFFTVPAVVKQIINGESVRIEE